MCTSIDRAHGGLSFVTAAHRFRVRVISDEAGIERERECISIYLHVCRSHISRFNERIARDTYDYISRKEFYHISLLKYVAYCTMFLVICMIYIFYYIAIVIC